MRKLLFLTLCLLLLSQEIKCQHEDDRPLNKKKIEGSFKYKNLKDFQIDSTLWENEMGENRLRLFDRYFSSQKNNRSLEEFTVYSQYLDEIMFGSRITYLIFNRKGNLISRFIVSEDSHEISEIVSEDSHEKSKKGYFIKSKGKFIDGNTYELESKYGWESERAKEITYSKTTTLRTSQVFSRTSSACPNHPVSTPS